jgi:hypothetical protein
MAFTICLTAPAFTAIRLPSFPLHGYPVPGSSILVVRDDWGTFALSLAGMPCFPVITIL